MPNHVNESARMYDDRKAVITALLAAVLLDAGIIALFMFLTWLTYATN